MHRSKLTREQRNAIQVYHDNESKLDQLMPYSSLLKNDGTLLPTNFVAFSYLPILKSSIPKEKSWSWNQSNIKIFVTIDANTTISLKKLSPRRLGNEAGDNPSFKIWLYEIIKCSNKCYFVWCEKGREATYPVIDTGPLVVANKGLETPIGTIFPQQLSLQSLSFLKDFVDKNTASELGW